MPTNTQKSRLATFIRKDSNVFVKKPLPNELQPLHGSDECAGLNGRSSSYRSMDQSSSSANDSNSSLPRSQSLKRHLNFLDLMAVGIGCTIGSGLFVLCGLVANKYAGPASCMSWMLSGLAACLSGACYAELSARIPLAGSVYAYSFVAMGELPAMLAAACLSVEYIAASAAVGRSWGDKIIAWLTEEYGPDHWAASMKHSFFNPFAFVVTSGCIILLLNGVKESKIATNFFTAMKILVVLFMVTVGAFYIKPSNWIPFVPPQFAASGVLRGATGTFFGYLGYDEIAVLSGEAINPKKDLPRAILGTIVGVTTVYTVASLILTGMVPFEEISPVSGFPSAFRNNGAIFASQLTALGEIVTLPIVVMISIMGQPRLQYALARDGLLPSIFGELDGKGNFQKGIIISGLLMVSIATFIPFDHLNDMISCAVLTALSLTDTSLILLWYPSPLKSPGLSEFLMGIFHILSLTTGLLLSHCWHTLIGTVAGATGIVATISLVALFVRLCPRSCTFGSSNASCTSLHVNSVESDGYYRTPLVPYVPCLAIFTNWYLISQLEFFGILLHLGFLATTIGYYLFFAIHGSVGNNGGWHEIPKADKSTKIDSFSANQQPSGS